VYVFVTFLLCYTAKNPPNVFIISFEPGVFILGYILCRSFGVIFNTYFASVLANFPFPQFIFTPSPLGRGIKKGLPGVASLLILCAAAWPSPPG
jgi:hypothetical protein